MLDQAVEVAQRGVTDHGSPSPPGTLTAGPRQIQPFLRKNKSCTMAIAAMIASANG